MVRIITYVCVGIVDELCVVAMLPLLSSNAACSSMVIGPCAHCRCMGSSQSGVTPELQ